MLCYQRLVGSTMRDLIRSQKIGNQEEASAQLSKSGLSRRCLALGGV